MFERLRGALRKLLEEERVALPADERLFDELTATRWKANSAGKVAIEAKDALRERRRSPDRAEAVAMAFGLELTATSTIGGFQFTP